MPTEAGKQASAAFDPIKDDPAIHCDPGSPVRFWINVNEPFEIKREPDRVVVDHRFMDSQRVVHLNGAAPADAPRGTMGYSTGRFEGNALVVTTDHFVAGAIEPRRGILHTENLKLTERLEVNAEGELEITMTIDDPAFFEQPYTIKELFVRSRLGSRALQLQAGVPAMTRTSDDGDRAMADELTLEVNGADGDGHGLAGDAAALRADERPRPARARGSAAVSASAARAPCSSTAWRCARASRRRPPWWASR